MDTTNSSPPPQQPPTILLGASLSSDTSSGNDIETKHFTHNNNYVTKQNAAAISEYHVVTIFKNNIFKPKHVLNVTNYHLPENLEPSNMRQAMQKPHWR